MGTESRGKYQIVAEPDQNVLLDVWLPCAVVTWQDGSGVHQQEFKNLTKIPFPTKEEAVNFALTIVRGWVDDHQSHRRSRA